LAIAASVPEGLFGRARADEAEVERLQDGFQRDGIFRPAVD
jgi:hypothetical protein